MTGNKVFTLRMPENLRTAIDKRAEKRLRSINNEIVVLLKLGLVSETEESEALNTADKFISQIKNENQKQGGSQRPGK
jgi:hypothetical protein